MPFAERLIDRLALFGEVTEFDKSLLRRLKIRPKRLVADEIVLEQGETAEHCVIVQSGMLAACQDLPNNKRQIVSAHFPGEIPDIQSFFSHRVYHTLFAINEALVGILSRAELKQTISESPALTDAFWRQTLIDGAIFRQWITSNGNRGSLAGTAHLLCELMTRAAAANLLSNSGTWTLPFTQQQLGDALGLSVVHVNRTLRTLREGNAAIIESGRLRVLDWAKLSAIAGFDQSYLQLGTHAHRFRTSGIGFG